MRTATTTTRLAGRPRTGLTGAPRACLAKAPRAGLAKAPRTRLTGALRAGLALAICVAAATVSGCATGHPRPIDAQALTEAQTFPYYRVYWVGPSFQASPLAAVDGQKGYNSAVGESLYYGDCVRGKGIFGGGSCLLPLKVTTVVYRLHSNAPLGPQRNTVIRGVPATIYDEGRSLELYTGRVAVDVFSDSFARARAAAMELLPVNAPGSGFTPLPPPIYCPGLSGPIDPQVTAVMARLPRHACQRAAAALALAKSLS